MELKPPLVSVIRAILQPHQIPVKTRGTIIPSRFIDRVAEASGGVVIVHEQFINGELFSDGRFYFFYANGRAF